MLNAEQCWAAMVAHDATQDGRFFYSVKTTGVYCRPGCASRQPLRKNVAFYATNAEAEAAGFRPCKRCRPNEGSQAERHIAAVERACALIRKSDSLPSLDALASAAGQGKPEYFRVWHLADLSANSTNVCYWHKADMAIAVSDVRFRR